MRGGSADHSLISERAAEAATASIQSLVQSIPREEPKAAPRKTSAAPKFRSGSTVEDLVIEALTPMLKDWLDDNLPIIVEAIVREEIKKLIDRGLA